MISPKIAVDVATDAGSLINFSLQANTFWRYEEAPGYIRCMVANANESLLLTSSRTGERLWSLSTHPLLQLADYNNHANVPFAAAFLRDGQRVISCDSGSIHLWDIEYTRTALSVISTADKNNGFSSFHVLSAKYGVHPSIDGMGDEQFLATVQGSVCFYDIRCPGSSTGNVGVSNNNVRALHRVADWTLPRIPPPQGTLYNASIEPLYLTCANCHERYVYAGSSTGGLWVVDRRTGRVLNSWQANPMGTELVAIESSSSVVASRQVGSIAPLTPPPRFKDEITKPSKEAIQILSPAVSYKKQSKSEHDNHKFNSTHNIFDTIQEYASSTKEEADVDEANEEDSSGKVKADKAEGIAEAEEEEDEEEEDSDDEIDRLGQKYSSSVDHLLHVIYPLNQKQ